jgi:peptide/nickel transport system substrate-binding protein
LKRVFISVVIVMLLVFILAGCAAKTTTQKATTAVTTNPQATSTSPVTTNSQATSTSPVAGTPQYGGTIKIIVESDIGIIGAPSEAVAGQYMRVARPAMEYLVTFDLQGNIKPWLCESWKIADDGKSVTLTLRKGINFQDGTPLNAEAMKYNLDNYTQNGVRPAVLKNITSIDLVDEFTVRLNLAKSDSSLLYELGQTAAGMMASPTAMKKPTTAENMAKDHMVGTGPFKFVSYKRDTEIIYEKFNGYWQKGKPYVDRVEILQVADPVTRVMTYKAGDAQVIFKVSPKDANELNVKGNDIIVTDTMPIYFLAPDSVNPNSPFSNIKVRQAAEYALDKVKLAKSAGEGYYIAATQFANEKDACYVPGLQARTFDVQKAKQLLAEAGFPNGFKTKLAAGPSTDRDILVVIQTYLQAVGITADLDLADTSRYATLYSTGMDNGLLMAQVGLTTSYLPSLSRVFNVAGSLKSTARPPDWQKNLDTALAEMNIANRNVLHQALIKTMFDQAMAIPLWGTPLISVQKSTVHDLNFTKGGQPHFYNIESVWLEK